MANDYTFIERELDAKGIPGILEKYAPSRSLSIVIAVLDRANLLRLGLEALKRQNLDGIDVELIVVDDGSGPDVKRICLESDIGWLRYARRDPDPRFTELAARNHGIRMARGDVIIQLDPEILFAVTRWRCAGSMRWFETTVQVAVTVPRLYIESAVA